MTSNRYASALSVRSTPQTQPIPGKSQVKNSAGGYVFALSDEKRLERFLILGNEGGTYYASERKLTKQNADALLRLISKNGVKAVETIAQISESGRAPKNDPAIFALAVAAKLGDDATRRAAYAALPRVCRYATALFQFVDCIEEFGGWSRGSRTAVANWYNLKTADQVAYQFVKYQQRNGRSHRDLFRLAHIYAPGVDLDYRGLYEYIRTGRASGYVPGIIQGFVLINSISDPLSAARIVRDYGLPREAVPTQFLNDKAVWEALLENMPMTAMIRNLATMTRNGIIAPFSEGTNKVISELTNTEKLRKARVHPIQILTAMLTYAQGYGVRSDTRWKPEERIVDALNDAFYATFENVTPAGKNFLLAQDVSGSMDSGTVAGVPGLTPAKAAAAMVLVTMNTEPMTLHRAFDTGLKDIKISPKMRLDQVVGKTAYNGGGTDCSMPMKYALSNDLPIDTFVVYTDNETWAGSQHASQALVKFREKSGRAAKLVVVGMTATGFTIADPNDAGMLDVVGFDTATPALISDFARE